MFYFYFEYFNRFYFKILILISEKILHFRFNEYLVNSSAKSISSNVVDSTNFSKKTSFQKNRFFVPLKRLGWIRISIAFGFTVFLLQRLRKYRFRRYDSDDQIIYSSYKPLALEVSMYRMLPLRTLSRVWGWINSIELPSSVRIPILKSYATAFGCNLNEAYIEDLRQFKNLNEFFRRELKPGLRPIAGNENDIVSPCDGTVLHMGSAQNGYLEQVKGITYRIDNFLGPISWKPIRNNEDYQQSLFKNCDNKNTDLYYCVIYLAPGDYHRFHSPVNWTIKYRRHLPGKLYSVKPTFASWFPNLFTENERAAYIGEWKYGFFAMVPVGAVNVGSISIYFDNELKTNQRQLRKSYDRSFENVILKKGDPFGEFNLGSTIVLIFEAPKNMKFQVQRAKKIKYGQLVFQ